VYSDVMTWFMYDERKVAWKHEAWAHNGKGEKSEQEGSWLAFKASAKDSSSFAACIYSMGVPYKCSARLVRLALWVKMAQEENGPS
jgi:hypothetical protein